MIKISDAEYFSNDGTIRFLNMDCNEFMKGLKENEFDLCHNDPPYELARFKKGSLRIDKSEKAKNGLSWDVAPTDEQFSEMFRVGKNQIFWGANNFILPKTEYFIVWDKEQTVDNFASAEYAWTNIKMPAKVFRYSIHKCMAERKEEGGKIHPTQKPISLYRWILQNYTKPTDTILDCFGGSMSSAIACHMERRKLTIIELDADYFKSALKRFDFYERQLTLF